MAEITQTEENKNEIYFTWYLEELKTAGYLEGYDREPENFLVLPSYLHNREIHFKVKANGTEPFTMMREITYTYDYRLFWTEKAMYIFTEIFDPSNPFVFGMPKFVSHLIKIGEEMKTVSFIDVKDHNVATVYGRANSTAYTFPLIQKILMYTRGLYINKIIPTNNGKYGLTTCLFATTFTPTRYRHTDQSSRLRDIKFRKTTLETYANNRQTVIDGLLEKKQGNKSQQSLL